jgi:hypothetical protein
LESTASGRVTPIGYADPGRMLVKSFILFRVSRFPLKIIIENGKRETKKLQIQWTPRFTGGPTSLGLAQPASFRHGWLLMSLLPYSDKADCSSFNIWIDCVRARLSACRRGRFRIFQRIPGFRGAQFQYGGYIFQYKIFSSLLQQPSGGRVCV